ncbi:MAG: cytochrome C oxidase subunit IV family protein [Bacteroidales bacterium]
MENNANNHITPYRTYFIVLLTLLVLTALSVAVTTIELGPLTVTVALLLATAKALIVLIFFMHLKFDNIIYSIMLGFVIFSIISIIVVTFLDYLFR